jgi:hypothetical protein
MGTKINEYTGKNSVGFLPKAARYSCFTDQIIILLMFSKVPCQSAFRL